MDTARANDVSIPKSIGNKVSGSTFDKAFTSAPWTLPSHASLFTGAPPSKHGAHAGHKHLNDTLYTLPEILSEEGYETVAVSNNTWVSGEFGFDRGFETFYKTWQYVQSETDLGRIAREAEGFDKVTRATRAIFDGNPVTNLTNAIYGQFFRKSEDNGAARTNAWIEEWLTDREVSRPFFLFVNYLEPHLEYRPPKKYTEEYLPAGVSYEEAMAVPQDAWGYVADQVEISDEEFEILRALYRSEISYLEAKISDLVQYLKGAGEWEETIFILTSDHGENIGEHGLMDHQYALYDTLLHVPLYVHGGPFDEVDSDPVQLLDIPPTILDTLNIDALEAREQFQGISFHPDATETREAVFAEYMAPQPSMEALEKRVGMLPEHIQRYDRRLRAVRTDQYKYVRGSDGFTELYDVQTDPGELDNIATTHDDVVASLDTKLDEWLESFEHATATEDVQMSDETKSRLEDLGYLQ